jgi:hypothetical protein
MSAIRKLAVAPTDNGRRTPELAAGIAHVKIEVHRRARSEPALAQTGAIAPERAGHHDHQGAARPRHLRRAAGRAFRRREVAALTDGRCSGGFTPEATVAARHANAPELSDCDETYSVRGLRPRFFARPAGSRRGGEWRVGRPPRVRQC